jgi:hypothetical protein
MRPIIPLDIILERLREEQRPERSGLRIYAPQPEPPRAPEPVQEQKDEQPQRGVAIIDFTV